MIIYVDESGNLGNNDGYFSITALIVRKSNKKGKRIKNVVKNFLAKNNIEEIKGRELSVPQRQKILNKLQKEDDHHFGYICLDKKNLKNQELFNNQAILFNYLFQLLFKEIIFSVIQQDKSLKEIDDIKIFVDERNIKIGNGKYIEDYIKSKVLTEWDIPFSNIFVNYCDSKDVKLIQITDLASGIIHNRYKSGQRHEYNFLKIKHSIRFPQSKFKLID